MLPGTRPLLHAILGILALTAGCPNPPTTLASQDLLPRMQLAGFSSAVLHPLIRLLDGPSDELRERALDTLCSVALAIGPDFAIFVPTVKKARAVPAGRAAGEGRRACEQGSGGRRAARHRPHDGLHVTGLTTGCTSQASRTASTSLRFPTSPPPTLTHLPSTMHRSWRATAWPSTLPSSACPASCCTTSRRACRRQTTGRAGAWVGRGHGRAVDLKKYVCVWWWSAAIGSSQRSPVLFAAPALCRYNPPLPPPPACSSCLQRRLPCGGALGVRQAPPVHSRPPAPGAHADPASGWVGEGRGGGGDRGAEQLWVAA